MVTMDNNNTIFNAKAGLGDTCVMASFCASRTSKGGREGGGLGALGHLLRRLGRWIRGALRKLSKHLKCKPGRYRGARLQTVIPPSFRLVRHTRRCFTSMAFRCEKPMWEHPSARLKEWPDVSVALSPTQRAGCPPPSLSSVLSSEPLKLARACWTRMDTLLRLLRAVELPDQCFVQMFVWRALCSGDSPPSRVSCGKHRQTRTPTRPNPLLARLRGCCVFPLHTTASLWFPRPDHPTRGRIYFFCLFAEPISARPLAFLSAGRFP